MKIAVLTGGTSSERDVALASGIEVIRALRERGHHVDVVDYPRGYVAREHENTLLPGGIGRAPPSADELASLGRGGIVALAGVPQLFEADVLFLALHGGDGENGTLQAALDLLGLPYTGSGHLGSALAFDKDTAKRVLRDAGVTVPRWLMAPAAEEAVARDVGYPCIVKPSNEGSSVGLSKVTEPAGMAAAVRLAQRYDRDVMIEEFIPGRELTVGVLAGRALPVIEIIARHELFDYECKYTPGMSEEFPAKLDAGLERRLQEAALLSHRVLKLGGYSRVDFRVADDGGIFCLEANTLPGLTAASLLPKAATAAGMSFAELCESICRFPVRKGGTKPQTRG